jgi:hypothetical protein
MDYGSHYSNRSGKKQKIAKRTGAGSRERKWMGRTIGVVIMLAVGVGVVASLWFGYRINSTLDQISMQQEKLERTKERSIQLQLRQEELLSLEIIQEAVRGRGLYPPTPEQIKRL